MHILVDPFKEMHHIFLLLLHSPIDSLTRLLPHYLPHVDGSGSEFRNVTAPSVTEYAPF